MLGEFLFLLGVEFFGIFREGFEGTSGLGKLAIQLLHVGIVRFFQAVSSLQRGMAEPFLFLLRAEFFQTLFHLIDVFLINHCVLGELFELGVDLRPGLRLAGRGGGGGLPCTDGNQQSNSQQSDRCERGGEGFREMPFEAVREALWRFRPRGNPGIRCRKRGMETGSGFDPYESLFRFLKPPRGEDKCDDRSAHQTSRQ